jgi:hypothetical protein
MVARITLYPVGNGDMTLIELESGRKVLIDVNVRAAADDPDDDTFDAAKALRNRLTRDRARATVCRRVPGEPSGSGSLRRIAEPFSSGSAVGVVEIRR